MSRNTFIWITIGIAAVVTVAIGGLCYMKENVAQAEVKAEKKDVATRDSIIAHVSANVDSLKMGQRVIAEQNDSILSIGQRVLRLDSINNKEIKSLKREVKRLQKQK